jgi:uncharacterized protein YbjT (DUF2867 family)
MSDSRLILVTGATGYVGGQLIPGLLADGYKVRVLARDIRKLDRFSWKTSADIVTGDAFEPRTLKAALCEVDIAYYLIHNMTVGSDFAERDTSVARSFGEAAKNAGVRRIIYLGGLGSESAELSEHLRSRHETGEALRSSGVPVTEFRAAIIVGAGSISFEMIRYLAERIPLMICPRWVGTRVQPISIEDVLSYLIASIETPKSAGETIEIGGADVLTYGEMMKGYARVRGLRRLLLNVPVLTPRLSSYWVHWVTPVSAAYARPLIEGLRNEVIVTDCRASELFPQIRPVGYVEAVSKALSQLDPEFFPTGSMAAEVTRESYSFYTIQNGMVVEIRKRAVRSSQEAVYRAFTELGGSNNWPCDWAWRVRAAIDRMIGGVGMRKGRPETHGIKLGDAMDFFRVVKIEPDRTIRLKAEMKLPGEGWLQFDAEQNKDGRTSLVQTVFFAPRGLMGIIYWYLLGPIHKVIFARMIAKLAAKAENN